LKEVIRKTGGNCGKARLMFQDEAGFGRINKPKYCWCFKGLRPTVPCHHIREYRYAYGAVEPATGESFFLVMPYSNTACMNVFLQELSNEYPNDLILLVCDRAAWHTSGKLTIPGNIRLFFLPPATPEMNPVEQIWKEIRKRGFRNEIFKTLDNVIDRLCDTICALTKDAITSISGRDWILGMF
jgi:putative transposase